MLIGSTGPMLFTYTAVSIIVGLTETQQKTYHTQAVTQAASTLHWMLADIQHSSPETADPSVYLSKG